MKWVVVKCIGRWRVELIDAEGAWLCSFAPDQFGRVRYFSSCAGKSSPVGFAEMREACEAAKLRVRGRRFGACNSAVRERLCLAVAEEMNKALAA